MEIESTLNSAIADRRVNILFIDRRNRGSHYEDRRRPHNAAKRKAYDLKYI